jgi:hypothetical protein
MALEKSMPFGWPRNVSSFMKPKCLLSWLKEPDTGAYRDQTELS